MERRHYVNAPVDGGRRTRQKHQSGAGSAVYSLIGLGFGVLCIIQASLNIYLWLQTEGASNGSRNCSTYNFTSVPADDIRAVLFERDQLLEEKEKLLKEKNQLLQDKNKLHKENSQLNEDKKQLLQKNMQLTQDKDQLALDKTQLLQDNSQLNKDKQQLSKDKQQLLQEITKLNEDKRLIQENIHPSEVSDFLNTALQYIPGCPLGWTRFQSNCYQVSSYMNSWHYAKHVCESLGAHLVTISDPMEEAFVKKLIAEVRGPVNFWIGLMGYEDSNCIWTWTWLDGRGLYYTNWSPDLLRVCGYGSSLCTYLDQSHAWLRTSCNDWNDWICKKDLSCLRAE